VAAMQHRYRELRMPVVIMAGTQDRIIDHRKHSVWLHQEIAQSALRLVPAVGHMLHYAVPEQVVDAIEASFGNPTPLRSAESTVERPQCPRRPLPRRREHGAGATSRTNLPSSPVTSSPVSSTTA
jgi:hypothetical protein